MIADSVFAAYSQSAGYYDTYNNEGFYMDKLTSEVVYFSYDETYSEVEQRVQFVTLARKGVKLTKTTFTIILDLCNLAVSTSSPQLTELLTNPSENFFVYMDDVAGCEYMSNQAIELGGMVCKLIKAGDVAGIESLEPQIRKVANLYKSLVNLEVWTPKNTASLYVGSLASRVNVELSFYDIDVLDDKTYEKYASIVERLASYLLSISDSRIGCHIYVEHLDTDYDYRIDGPVLMLWVGRQDLSYLSLVKKIDALLKMNQQ